MKGLDIMNKDNSIKKLSTQPYKGARDFYPEDMRIRNYIFDTWKKVCKRYGFEEYDFPFLENWDIYAAKTGEEIVNKQLYWFKDRGGRKVAIRPEKTPSVARMIAAKINELSRPIKWFNIGNCWRYEKPQKGRGREFFQFDCDIFGVSDTAADIEVFSIPIEIMKALGATQKMFEIKISNRRLTEYFLKELACLEGDFSQPNSRLYKTVKAIDTKLKVTELEFEKLLEEAKLTNKQIQRVNEYLNYNLDDVKKYKDKCYGAEELIEFFRIAESIGYKRYFKFSPEIMRGFDYYTGNVIEQFDLNPKNNRSMYGGGRYDDLVGLFTKEKLTAVGFAMGDMTLIEFLKGWNLLPALPADTQVMVTVFDESLRDKSFETAQRLREKGINAFLYLEADKLDKQLKYADRKGIPYVIIIGPDEVKKGKVVLRDMRKKEQNEIRMEEITDLI